MIAGTHELFGANRARHGRFITLTHLNRYGEWQFIVVYDAYDQETGGLSPAMAEEIARTSVAKHGEALQLRLMKDGWAKVYSERNGAILWSTDSPDDSRTIPPVKMLPGQSSQDWTPLYGRWPIHAK